MTIGSKINREHLCLPLAPVLGNGLIIFAQVHTNGERIISFEDPICSFSLQPSLSANERKRLLYAGRGESIDHALACVLHDYHTKDSEFRKTYRNRQRPIQIAELMNRLDRWLVKHGGQLRAVSDFDGFIAVRLEGLIDPGDIFSYSIIAEATGKTFYHALARA